MANPVSDASGPIAAGVFVIILSFVAEIALVVELLRLPRSLRSRAWISLVGIQLLTFSFLFWALDYLEPSYGMPTAVTSAETAIVLLEAGAYWLYLRSCREARSIGYCLFASTCGNATSLALGFLLGRLAVMFL